MIEIGLTNNEAIDWENFLDNVPDELGFDLSDDPAAATAAADGIDSYLSIDDIEQYLMNDESNSNIVVEEHHVALADEFFSDLLLDSPHGSWLGSDFSKDSSSSPDSVVVEAEVEEREEALNEKSNSSAGPDPVVVEAQEEEREEDSSHEKISAQINEDKGGDAGETDDPVDRKRKRQIRNRDAAVRSRERKKMYLRDLELKSKYYEAECKRLGTLLQCCLAENQSLRLCLHNSKAFDVSMDKQESAVLLLESLLLGSLLGFLGIIYLLILGSQFLVNLEVALHEDVGGEEWESEMTSKVGMEACKIQQPVDLFMLGKRCKASRSRMRLRIIEFSSGLLSKTQRLPFFSLVS
ncbi:bZIP transcription factor 60-like [Dorcoceras hygrometricum]|uniref:BZIP transcription factor 60-like n=1 Tax=Dorcoceras hygrometricum TaxID=472368 RepID=A0A2Z7BCG7_9LAMI|nr:bZIP transcription factor 60-like [Dorcoceras hygrometricum]KZV32194.1 bZIP transcription factor 60-like [Dorcoceras hygrometricum]